MRFLVLTVLWAFLFFFLAFIFSIVREMFNDRRKTPLEKRPLYREDVVEIKVNVFPSESSSYAAVMWTVERDGEVLKKHSFSYVCQNMTSAQALDAGEKAAKEWIAAEIKKNEEHRSGATKRVVFLSVAEVSDEVPDDKHKAQWDDEPCA